MENRTEASTENFQKLLEETYSVTGEANTLANKAFGGDYKDAVSMLDKYRDHSEQCGCMACQRVYEKRLMEEVDKFARNKPEDYD